MKAIIFTVMIKNICFLFTFIFALSACKSEADSLSTDKNSLYLPSLLNLNTLLTEDENDVSFPIWFNDSIIKAHKIKKITRKSFPRNSFEEGKLVSISSTVPREIREYYFNEKGILIQLNVHNYYDDREIGSVLFSYYGIKDSYGFSPVKRNKFVSKTDKPFAENDDPLELDTRELDFRMHEKKKSYNKCLVFQDMESGDYLFYVPNRRNWRALSIDSMLVPTPKDNLVWGKPMHPTKKYQVSNKVNEKNIREYNYQKNQKAQLVNWVKKEYPFDLKRDFIYKKGNCVGYIDSTFSEDIYVTRIISEIQYNKKKEPIRIIHRKENSTYEKQFLTLETFEYE